MISIQKAVVLAAGRGTRMGAATLETPKPMLPVHGAPILEHVLRRLEAAGAEQLLLVVGYQREKVEQYFRGWHPPVCFRVQDEPNGTGTAVLLARDFVGDMPFLLTFGDILCEPAAYVRCAEVLHQHPGATAVLGVNRVDDPFRAAAVYVKDGIVQRIIEKPPKGTSTTPWSSAGIYAFRPAVFSYLARIAPSPRGEFELTSAFELMLDAGLEFRTADAGELWLDIGRPEDLESANADPNR